MMRLVLLAAFVAIVIFIALAAVGTVTAAAQIAGKDNTAMPTKFRRITYVLLILLMLGVTSGLLGGL